MNSLAILQLGIEQVLAVLGLGADNPATVLAELRERALVRCANLLQQPDIAIFQHQDVQLCVGDSQGKS